MQRILVLGGGFAGLWAAAGAARLAAGACAIALVDRNAHHNIRVRNYESDLADVRVPFDDVLGPIGVARIEAEVLDINVERRVVRTSHGEEPYDRLVCALGSVLQRPPQFAAHTFDVDTYDAAVRLAAHLATVPAGGTVIVIGAGLTGIETACEMPDRVPGARVILIDRAPVVGSDMGEAARPAIEAALASLGIETRLGATIAHLDAASVTLAGGERIPAAAVVWCAGMRAHPLTARLGVPLDALGRLPVDASLRVQGLHDVLAAGDCARAILDDTHASVMSCQHGRPMGRFAGHNAAADALGRPLLPLRIEHYVTCLDLGPAGALYTEGWERRLVAAGPAVKQTKRTINRERIYPPLTRDRAAILAAAAPVVQVAPPARTG